MRSGSRTEAGFRINEGPLEQGRTLKDNSRVAVIGGGPRESAIDKFNESSRCFGGDGPSRFYLDMCEYYRINPVGESWDELIQLEKK